VDGVGRVLTHTPLGEALEVGFEVPAALAPFLAPKGSIAVDGVSLTVAAIDGETFTVALIPTTLTDTTLGIREPGDVVNLEVDVVAKYVERLAAGYLRGSVEVQR
jgi:riboflavin synthase